MDNKKTSIGIRVENTLKENFESVCLENGITMSEAFREFMEYVVVHHELPFQKKIGIVIKKK